MAGAGPFSVAVAIFIGIAFMLALIYGVGLSLKLMRKGEWQWFCLPFIGIFCGIAGQIIEHMPFVLMAMDEVRITVIWVFPALILVSLLSGCGVYWLMWRYRKETVFVHFYAASYFLNAIVLLISIAVIFTGTDAGISTFLLGLVAVYGFIVTCAGIAAMRKRVRLYRKAA